MNAEEINYLMDPNEWVYMPNGTRVKYHEYLEFDKN